MKVSSHAAWACLLVSTACVAQPDMPSPAPQLPLATADCREAFATLPSGAILDLLDPDAPEERRQHALTAYQQAAESAACPEFGYTLGLLYRFGPDMPGNLLPRDLPKARLLIRKMAEAGYLQAYADLAELEMVHGQYRESMKWTQVYLYFVKNIKMPRARTGNDVQFDRSAYNGHLLNRAEVVWRWQKPAVPRRHVNQDLTSYLAEHETRVGALIAEGERGWADLGPTPRTIADPGKCYLKALDRVGAATASYVLEVQPSGQISRIITENFVPNTETADFLKTCVKRYQFAAFDGNAPRMTRISMTYGSSEGASIRR
jgi:TPR repeat protein